MQIKGTLDAEKLRKLTKEAAHEAWRKREDQKEQEARMNEKEKQKAQLAMRATQRQQRIDDCIAQIPYMLEKAARGEQKSCVVFSSPRNNDDIAPEIFAYCNDLPGLEAAYKIENIHPEGFACEYTVDDTIYRVVVRWLN